MPLAIAAIDQGTTSTRCMLIGSDGSPLGFAQKEHRQHFPQPGWVEHDPLEIWHNTRDVMEQALLRAGLVAADVAAIGVTNQRETFVVWERSSGKPIHPAIVWQDTRSAEICASLAEVGWQERIRETTGLPVSTYFSGPKLRWLLDHVDGARARGERGELLFGTMDTWLIWNLTGGLHVTDPSNASRTLLMDLTTLDWDEELLEVMGVPRAMLPDIRSSSEILGAAQGTFAGVPVSGCLGDQQAALVGQVCFDPGDAKNTYGTGCFLLLNTGCVPVKSRHGLLTTVAYRFGNSAPVYALEGSIAVSGALVQWLRDNLGLINHSGDVEALANTVPDNGGMYIVPAFSGLFAPYWRSDARGVFVGLTRYINKGHIARAALEATAYQTRDILDAMQLETGHPMNSLKVDGGMVMNETLMQFQADMIGIPVTRPRIPETTTLGAAFAAGLGVGFWSDTQDLRRYWQQGRTWNPTMEAGRRSALYAGWQKAVQRTFDWAEAGKA